MLKSPKQAPFIKSGIMVGLGETERASARDDSKILTKLAAISSRLANICRPASTKLRVKSFRPLPNNSALEYGR